MYWCQKVGEIGGVDEEEAAEYVAARISKYVVAHVAGSAAPLGKTMGHAGAVISGAVGTVAAKRAALEAAGIPTVSAPPEVVPVLQSWL